MPWIKAWHVIFMVTWFAGLFYLPRLFVYHAGTTDSAGIERFRVMERRLFTMMTIGASMTILFGVWMLAGNPSLLGAGWMRAKLAAVALLLAYHAWSWALMRQLAAGRCDRSPRWFRAFNEVPSLFLVAIVLLAIVRPF
jgi:putative membrane protein